MEAEVLDHAVIFAGVLSWRGEVVADEQRVGGIESQRLQAPQVHFTSSGDADFGSWVSEPEECEDFEAVDGVEDSGIFQWCAVDRVKEVDGDGFDTEFLEFVADVDHVVVSFSHADDQSAAEFQVLFSAGLERIDSFLVGVSRADFVVESSAGIEIVIDAVDSGLFESSGLIGIEQTEAAADMQPGVLFDVPDGLCNLIDIGITGRSTAGDDAVGACLVLGGLSCSGDELFGAFQSIAIDGSIGDGGLRAVAAVFRAESTLGVFEVVELDIDTEVFASDAEGGGHQVEQFCGVGVEDIESFVAGELLPTEDLFGNLLPAGRGIGHE